MDKLFIIIPAYNEMDNIKSVIDEWYPIIEKVGQQSRLVVIDDGSKDQTYSLINQSALEKSQLVPLTKKNEGHGATVLYGYHYAIDHGADYIFQTDADGQTVAAEFWQFWDARDSYKMIIGHRRRREDGISRIAVTKVLKIAIRLCFGITVTDANTPYRLLESNTLKKYISIIPNKFNLANVLISVIYIRGGASVRWIPITFRPRQGGVNSINIKKIVVIGKRALKDFREFNHTMKGLDI